MEINDLESRNHSLPGAAFFTRPHGGKPALTAGNTADRNVFEQGRETGKTTEQKTDTDAESVSGGVSQFQVIASTVWHRKFADPQSGGGVVGQVTHIRVGGIDAFVRENVRVDTFREMSSGHRRGVAMGGKMPGTQVLELATGGHWDTIAAAIRAADPKDRPVLSNRQWTPRIAMRVMREGRGR